MKLIFLLLSLLTSVPGLSETRPVSFYGLSSGDGLSHDSVISLTQDRDGAIWIATHDGLDRYDGYGFRVYRHRQNDPASLADNYVRGVIMDTDGVIWVSSGSYISRYDRSSDSFRNFATPNDRNAFVVGDMSPGYLMVACSDSVFCFDKSAETFVRDYLPQGMRSIGVRSFLRDGNRIFLGTSDGRLLDYDPTTGRAFQLPLQLTSASIRALSSDGERLWIGTDGDGLYEMDRTTWTVRHHSGELESDYVRSLEFDSAGRLWIGTYDGLAIMEDGKFFHIRHDPDDRSSLSYNSIRTIMRDHQGGMWVGTYMGGINYWHPSFTRLLNDIVWKGDKSFTDNVVSCVASDPDGSVWMGVGRAGIIRYDPASGSSRSYAISRTWDASSDIKAIFPDPDRRHVYLGFQYGGFWILDKRTGEISKVGPDPMNVYAITPKDDGSLYLGTSKGLMLYDRRSSELKETGIPQEIKDIRTVTRDSSSNLWIGGYYGVRVFREEDGALVEVDIEGLDRIRRVTHIKETSRNAINILTNYGYSRFDTETHELVTFTTEDGMPGSIAESVEEDQFGYLWIGTDSGLCRYNPISGTIRTYGRADGMESSIFMPGSSCVTPDGNLVFGTSEGTVSFMPSAISENPFNPCPKILSATVLGTSSEFDGEPMPVWKDISGSELRLSSHERSFELTFATMNYLSAGADIFSYRLSGYEKNWHTLLGNNKVSYSNLPAGKYVLELKAANNDGVWCEDTAELKVYVKPYWYQTLLFKIALLMLLALAVYAAFKSMDRSREEAHRREVHMMNVRFYINFFNELKTPLTLLQSPLREMMSRADNVWMKRQLKYVDSGASNLIHMINQLIDYRKADLGILNLHATSMDVEALVSEIISRYENYARSRNLTLTLSSNLEGRKCLADPGYLEIILTNLLSNSFQNTEEGGISVSLELDGDLELAVADTGSGMKQADIEKVESGYDDQSAGHIGRGLGLAIIRLLCRNHHCTVSVESKEGEGTVFRITMPQNRKAFTEGELLPSEAPYVVRQQELEPVAIAEELPADVTDSGRTLPKVLLFVGDTGFQNYLNESLCRSFDVILADEADEVVGLVKVNDVDALIMETWGDSSESLKLCSKIKTDLLTSHVPVIILSSSSDNADQLSAFRAGADDYISKPFSVTGLAFKVYNIITTNRSRQNRLTSSSGTGSLLSPLDEEFLRKAVAVVEANMSNSDFSTLDFASQMSMSRSALHMKIKAVAGKSALDFIRDIRFREACRLLEEGKYKVSAIGAMVGFCNPSHFTRSFKKVYGILPSEYVGRQRQ